MELVYLWVEDYKNIHKQGFNFSPRFTCDYNDETNELTIDDNPDYIENFFGDNINVTAIVGKNGSGKSAIIDTLINDIIFNQKIEYKRQSLYCYLNDDKDKLYINSHLITEDNVQCNFKYKMTHINSEDDISEYTGCEFQYRVKKLDKFTESYNKSFFYFYNNSLELDNFLRKEYTYNEKLLFYPEVDKSNDSIDLEIENNKMYNYLLEIFLNKNRLPNELKDIFIPTKIFLDRKIIVEFFNKDFQEEDSYRNFLENSNVENILKLETLIHLRNFLNNSKFHHNMDNDIEQLKIEFNDKNIVDSFEEILVEVEFSLKNILERIDSIKSDIRHDDNKSNDTSLESLIELEKIANLIEDTSEIALLIQNIRNDPYYDYEIYTDMLNRENISKLKQLPSYLPIDFATKKSVKFSELSSGEQNILKLLFSIENIIHLREGKTDSFYILLDEIENTFHPDWQKRIIEWLTSFFRYYDDIQLNIIVTSHSPFLLSDIPKQNIIFLDTYKEEDSEVQNGKQEIGNCKVVDGLKDKKQTFGANIHTLLSDSFFMKDGLMGEFAKGKINEIINFHKEVEENKKKKSNCFSLRRRYLRLKTKFWQTQSIIGEEYLKQVIKNHLVEIEKILLGKDMAKEEEIARTEVYLESLKNVQS